MQAPNHRYVTADRLAHGDPVRAGASDCELVRYLLAQKNGGATVETFVTRAADIYLRNQQSRLLLEAMLLAPDGSIEKICETMEVKKEMVEAYRHFFFDLEVFRDKFDVVDFVSSLADDRERITKRAALTEGFHYLATNFTGKDLDLSPTQVCKKIQTFAYQMVSQAKGHTVTSAVAKEAKYWAGIVKTFTEQLAKEDPDAQGDFLTEFKILLAKGEKVDGIEKLQGMIVHG